MNKSRAIDIRANTPKLTHEAFLSLRDMVEALEGVEHRLKEAKADYRLLSMSSQGTSADSAHDFAVSTALREVQAAIFQVKAAKDSLRVGGL